MLEWQVDTLFRELADIKATVKVILTDLHELRKEVYARKRRTKKKT